MSPGLYRLIKVLGFPVYGVIAYVLFCYWTFPLQAYRRAIEGQVFPMGSWNAEVASIGSLSLRPLLTISADDVALRFTQRSGPVARRPLLPAKAAMERPEPGQVEEAPLRVSLQSVTASVGLSTLMGLGSTVRRPVGAVQEGSFDVAVQGLGGTLDVSYNGDDADGLTFELDGEDLDVAQIPQFQAMGPPLRGKLSLKVNVDTPGTGLVEATGRVEIDCTDCSIGDGKKKLKIPGNALLAMGLTIPLIRLGKISGDLPIDKGVLKLDGLTAVSPDVEMHLDGTVTLRSRMDDSIVNAYLRFRISPDLKKRRPELEIIESALANGKRPDGFFGLRISGSLRRPLVVVTREQQSRSPAARSPGRR